MSISLRLPSVFATRRSRTIAYGVAVAGTALGAALFSHAEPTGSANADAFWSAALVAVVATFGATARRWTWFVPTGVAALLGDTPATIVATVALVIAFASVLHDSRSRARGALVTGLGTIAMLRAGPVGFHGSTALLTVAAITPALVSGYLRAGRRVQARARRVGLVAGGVIGLMVAGAVLGLLSVSDDVADGVRAIDGGMEAAREADDDLAAEQLDQAARSLTTADSVLSGWFVSPARTLPLIGPNIDAVGSLAAQAGEVAQVTSLAASSADVDMLRFLDGRLDPQAVANMQDPLEQVQRSLERMEDEVTEVRSPWLINLVSSRIDRLDGQIDDAVPDAKAAVNAVGVAPALLGADGPQRYLVLFTTPVEARGRTGFPGNYAELVIDDGKLTMPVFGRVSELEQAGAGTARTLQSTPEMVARYGRFDIATTWRNLTMTPDFVSLTQAAAELYPQSGGQPIDGLLSVDPAGLAAIMRYTGPVEVAGLPEPLTADNAEQYLLYDQYVQFEADNEARIDLLETVARTTFERLTAVDLPSPRAVTEHFDSVIDGGHIQFATIDPVTFLPLQVMGVTGWLSPIEGDDAVTVTTANAGGNKIDLFLRRREQYTVRWDPQTGEVTSTLRLTLENTAPAAGWPDYVIGNLVGLPRGTNRSYVSMYSPYALAEARIGGQPAGLQAETELGRNVYSTFVDIPPGGSVEIELDLTGTAKGRTYDLALPVQPFVQADEFALDLEVVGGGELTSDEAEIDGDGATWSGTLDRSHVVAVTAGRD